MTTPTLTQIRVHPIKGVAQSDFLTEATARSNMRLTGDREWAFRIGSDDPHWARKNQFLQAMRFPKMAGIQITDYSDTDISLVHQDQHWDFDLTEDSEGFQKNVNDVARYIGYTEDKPIHLVQADWKAGKGFTDKEEPYISIGNLNTVRTLASMFNYWDDDVYSDESYGLQLDRFGINLWLDNLPAFEELTWLGKTIQIGDIQLRINAPITRCPKINANPCTGEQDITLLQDLIDYFRTHPNLPEGIPNKPILGMFATIINNGTLESGAKMSVIK